MIYSIDTSALIDLDRYYPYDVFPSLWDEHIVNLVNERRLIATEEVKEELEKGDDKLYKWLTNNCKSMFIKTNKPIMNRVIEIVTQFKNIVNPDKPDKNHADPFVIALAFEFPNIYPNIFGNHQMAVVSHEKFTGNLKGPKIPDICREYKIRVLKLIDIFKTEGWKIGK